MVPGVGGVVNAAGSSLASIAINYAKDISGGAVAS